MNNFYFTANVLYDNEKRVKNIIELQKNLKKKIFLNRALNWRNKKDCFLINKLLRDNKIRNNIDKKKPGEVAIWASNIKNYIHFIKNTNKKYLVIFEDDIKVTNKFWNIFYFLTKRFKSFSVGKYFECVCYNRRTVKRILNSIRKNGINRAIDIYCWRNKYVKHIRNNNIRQYREKLESKRK